ncbi:SseB family protein [uncultured Methanobrevibacter sp.]|uniref:SseB family protein n=1 Tax=uncultured Methanobrevibacter sp. TaxID=253161 RepID=UPI0026215A56|nr:SseB family protein [uncultured Methanobrevibacter sp.]
MDDKQLEELKKQAVVDNSALEEIMKKKITPESQMEFFEIFKESQLFMPVTYSENMFEGIENAKEGDVFESKGQIGFDINYLTDGDGNKAVPLFTSEEVMEKAGVRSSVYGLYMSDLAYMLKQTDRYSVIAINPFTEFDINMPVQAFLSLFEEPSEEQKKFLKHLTKLLEILKEHSIELEENTTLFIRDDENFMIDNAVDGVFTPNAPFYVSSNPKFGEKFKYTNILLMPKSKRILPTGPDNELDIIIAPGTEFKLQDTMDGTQNLWMCGEQPFYD